MCQQTLRDLPGIGRTLEEKLHLAGVESPEALRAMGSQAAFLRVRESVDAQACLHMLYALEGAAQGIAKKEISTQRKAQLKAFFETLE